MKTQEHYPATNFFAARTVRIAIALAIVAILAATWAAFAAPIRAQEDTIALGIQKYNCPTAEGLETGYAHCDLGGGVTFEVATAGGEVLGTCTTEIGVVRTAEVASCYVMGLPFDTELVITEEVSTGPAGYVPLENPKVMTIERPAPDAADFTPTVIFVNVLADADNGETDGGGTPTDEDSEPVDTIALPNTGSGVAASGVSANVLAGSAMLVLSGASLVVRRQLCR